MILKLMKQKPPFQFKLLVRLLGSYLRLSLANDTSLLLFPFVFNIYYKEILLIKLSFGLK